MLPNCNEIEKLFHIKCIRKGKYFNAPLSASYISAKHTFFKLRQLSECLSLLPILYGIFITITIAKNDILQLKLRSMRVKLQAFGNTKIIKLPLQKQHFTLYIIIRGSELTIH